MKFSEWRKTVAAAAAAVLFVGAFAGCSPASGASSSGGGGEENVPVSVTITSPANAALEPGEYELAAAVEPASASQTVSFSLEGTYEGIALSGTTLTIADTAADQLAFTVKAESTEKSDVSVTREYKVSNKPIWNKDPVVLEDEIFYDDFSEGVSRKYYTSSGPGPGWGVTEDERPNYMNPANISWSTDPEKVAEAGATGGIVALQVNGDLYPEEGRRREGASLITKKAFGPGKYEVRFKTVPRLGPVTALWTYWNGGGSTLEDNAYSEIDIEMPKQADYRQWSATVYKKYISSGMMEQGTATVKTEDGSGLNDGQWHTFAFEWITDTENGDNAVQYYVDGEPSVRIEGYTPEYTATFWMGAWFPDNPTWVGSPDFETAYMYIDYVKITPYADPIKTGARGDFDLDAEGVIGKNLGDGDIPVNDFVSNGSFQNRADDGSLIGWSSSDRNTALEATADGLALGEGAGAYQVISGQYKGTSYELIADASVTGSGKCTVYIAEYFGTVKMSTSEKLEFTASEGGGKKLTYTLKNDRTTTVRVYIETEYGTTAVVKNVKLLRCIPP